MTQFNTGDKVQAVVDIDMGLGAAIPVGTIGTITEVDSDLSNEFPYIVDFTDEFTGIDCAEDELGPIAQ